VSDRGDDSLAAHWREGDQQAAAELFRRYADRLIALARSRLSAQLARRVDPEDVVQSAYRSFFASTRDSRYEVPHGGDLWQLLVTITLHKLQHQVRKWRTGKRAAQRDQNFASEESLLALPVHKLTSEPTPLEAVALADLLEQIMRGLEARERRMLELRLQGHNLEEIAASTQRSRRTVRRVLEGVKEQLERSHSEPGSYS
jgi:RNA polymerase sigma-70 factor (ECF subfamily)